MNSNWLWQSFISLACLVPAWLAIAFLNRNYQVKTDVFLVWYMVGICVTTICVGEASPRELFLSWKLAGVVLVMGLTIGAAANILLFRAVSAAPNPGLPVAISGSASVWVFLVAFPLYQFVPKYFNEIKFDPWAFLGVMLTVAGVSLVALRR